MRPPIGVITGSGAYVLEGIREATEQLVPTEFGAVELTTGELAGVPVAHVSRHGNGHQRLSNQVNHRGNIAALRELGVTRAVGMATCGAVDSGVEPGEMVVFDDLYYPSNRLPDGTVCTLHTEPGDPARAHWMFEHPFSEGLRRALGGTLTEADAMARLDGCYGHVDGPRFNTRTEVRALSALGVTAIGQTAGPETVLCGEAGIAYALIGFVTGRANGAARDASRMPELMAGIGSSAGLFGALTSRIVRAAAATAATAPGVNHGFESDPELYSVASNGAAPG